MEEHQPGAADGGEESAQEHTSQQGELESKKRKPDPASDHGAGSEQAPSGKQRRTYVLTRPRETWSDAEHQRFLEALRIYERDWKQVERHVGTKTAAQIRSHAQKYFIKALRTGQADRVPPPKFKRYPALSMGDRDEGGQSRDEGGQGQARSGSVGFEEPSLDDALSDLGTALLASIPPAALAEIQNLDAQQQAAAALAAQAPGATRAPSQHPVPAERSLLDMLAEAQPVAWAPNMDVIYTYLGRLFDESAAGTWDPAAALGGMASVDQEITAALVGALADVLAMHSPAGSPGTSEAPSSNPSSQQGRAEGAGDVLGMGSSSVHASASWGAGQGSLLQIGDFVGQDEGEMGQGSNQ